MVKLKDRIMNIIRILLPQKFAISRVSIAGKCQVVLTSGTRNESY
jgi:hypothetical protein